MSARLDAALSELVEDGLQQGDAAIAAIRNRAGFTPADPPLSRQVKDVACRLMVLAYLLEAEERR